MNLVVPVYVKGPPPHKAGGDAGTYTVRPLFQDWPSQHDVSLRKALGRLRREIRLLVQETAREGREDPVAHWTFHPPLEELRVEIDTLRNAQGGPFRTFVAVFPALDRRIGWVPDLGLSFAVERGEDPEGRAVEVLIEHFRRTEHDESVPRPASVSLPGRASIATVEIEYEHRPKPEESADVRRISLGPTGPMEGWRELQKTGTDLGELYPDELDRVWFRDREVETLRRLLDERGRRPVLLLGPAGAGKTALVHEYVWRRKHVARRLKGRAQRGSLWHLHPQRLISGMSYVGQWEQRVHAILEFVEAKRHVLFFDDLVGLFHAGISSGSRLTVGHVLKEALGQARLRVVGEATPEAFRVLREIDRGFADLFRVLPVEPLDEAASVRVLIRSARALERGSARTVEPGAYPAVLQLQQRYNPREALPGKAVRFLRRVVGAKREGAAGGPEVLEEFARASGLNRRFLDVRATLEPREVRDFLRTRVVGQEEAVEAMVDVVALAKARLNDPGRPLGSLLFLGPTGVGKTECARALTGFLFGSEERMLRFDMNEYVDPGSAARLAGDRWRPSGLLTAAIRQQPFAVVLFDEIEKAHPQVHDLLLQVLGEGRLTDARGETADFSNAAILLTSNLGSEEAGARIGLAERAEDRRAAWVKAAERFFRPEFFNRLDRVVPFRALTRDEVRRVGELRVRELLGREGFVRRRVILHVHPWAMDRVADAGYHPQLGARALKRELEERIAKPAAARLAAAPVDRPVLLRMFAGPKGVLADVRPLSDAAPGAAIAGPPLPPAELVARLGRALERFAAAAQLWKPSGAVSVRALGERERLYFALHDRIEDFRRRLRRAAERLAQAARGGWGAARIARGNAPPHLRDAEIKYEGKLRVQEFCARLAAAERVEEFAAEVAEAALQAERRDPSGLLPLRRAAAHLDLSCRAIADGESPHCLILVRERPGDDGTHPRALLEAYTGIATGPFAGEVTLPAAAYASPGLWALGLAGAGFPRMFAAESGLHLVESGADRLDALEVRCLPVPAGQAPVDAARAAAAECEVWLERLRDGRGRLEDDPFRAGEVVRFHRGGERAFVLDVRSGLAFPIVDGKGGLRDALLAGLAEPEELRGEGKP